jgi:hypothetical protein
MFIYDVALLLSVIWSAALLIVAALLFLGRNDLPHAEGSHDERPV